MAAKFRVLQLRAGVEESGRFLLELNETEGALLNTTAFSPASPS